MVLTPPRQHGNKFSNWNVKNAQHHILLQFGKLGSIRIVVRVFRRQGLTLVRPRPAPAKGNPGKQQLFFDDLRGRIQHVGPRDRYFFFNAASVQRSATVRRMWADKGTQPKVKVCGGRERMHLLGILDCTEGRGWFFSKPRLDSERLIAFLCALMCVYLKMPLHIVPDNTPAHRAKGVKKFAVKQGRGLERIYLSPYSPRLNSIEKLWAYLRGEVTHNTYYDSFEAFQGEVVEFLRRFRAPN